MYKFKDALQKETKVMKETILESREKSNTKE